MKNILGALALFTALAMPSVAQPYSPWYPQPQRNYYINQPDRYQNQRLQLSVNSPTNGSSFRQGTITLRGTGTPGAQVIVNGDRSGSTVVNPNGHWQMPISLRGLAPGTTIHLTAFARDRFGNQSSATQLKYAVAW